MDTSSEALVQGGDPNLPLIMPHVNSDSVRWLSRMICRELFEMKLLEDVEMQSAMIVRGRIVMVNQTMLQVSTVWYHH